MAEKYNLPPIFQRNHKDCCLDPIRKKLIYITPEETVRQRVIQYLISDLGDDNITIDGKKVNFYHSGRITVGKLGSAKIDELRMFVADRCPELIKGNKFYLGSLTNDRLWRLDDEEVIKVITNMISYAMIRDEYREFVKKVKNKSGWRNDNVISD